jgi:hypothetical protein
LSQDWLEKSTATPGPHEGTKWGGIPEIKPEDCGLYWNGKMLCELGA